MSKTKPAKIYAFGDKKILSMEQRFKAKRDEHLLKKLEEQKDELQYWFANNYPEMELKVHLILSRKMEDLQVVKKIKYYKNADGPFSVISLEETVESNTWYNPYHMEKYIDNFLNRHINSIIEIVARMDRGI